MKKFIIAAIVVITAVIIVIGLPKFTEKPVERYSLNFAISKESLSSCRGSRLKTDIMPTKVLT